MTERIYRFEERKEPNFFLGDSGRATSSFEDIKEMSCYGSMQHLASSLDSLIKEYGTQRKGFDQFGYLIAIDGSYGAGKTTAAEALRDELHRAHGTKITSLYYSFLPFSNPNEAIGVFLSIFGEKLWRLGIADIRDDIQQFILEVTPDAEQPKATMGIGAASVTWSLRKNKPSYETAIQRIANKMSGLIQSNTTLVVILDDIDRLEPQQIVALVRMAEKLRKIPRMITIMPIYKDVVRGAFSKQLEVSPPNSAALLRKLIDFEIKIQNQQKDLEGIFKKAVSDNLDKRPKKDFLDKCWYILLHNILIAEAYDLVKDLPGGKEKIVALERSPYIKELRRIFDLHIRNSRRTEPYLTEFGNRQYFAPLGMHYEIFRDMNDEEMGPRQLSEIRNHNNVMKLVLNDSDAIGKFKSGTDYPTFDASLEQKSSEPALTSFFIPTLQKFSRNEPLLINNYKLRDMAILARAITGSRKFDATTKDDGRLYDLIREEYDDFR